MRNSMPLRWIEEAEARQVLALARDEALLPPPAVAASEVLKHRVERLRRCYRALLARPQQIGQRGNLGEAAEIANEA
jgi:hypothetical protein